MKGGNKKFLGFLKAARKSVVCKRSVRANKYVVTDPQTVPQLHATLDGDAITNNDVVLDQAMRADVAVLAYHGVWQHDYKLPDARAGADLR